VYICPICQTRYLGQQYCPDCHTFCEGAGPGGCCPLTLLRRTGRLPGADPVMLAISSRFPSNHQNPKVGEDAVRVGYWSREPSSPLCGNQPALQVRGSSATNRSHAAPALLTREYQSDDRRCQMTLTASSPSPPLPTPFHISGTKSSTACFHTSASTGAGSPW